MDDAYAITLTYPAEFAMAASGPLPLNDAGENSTYVPQDLVDDPRLSHLAVRVWALVARYIRDGEVSPSRKALARDLRVSLAGLKRALADLDSAGWIARAKPSLLPATAAPGGSARHSQLHALADRDGGWACHYCEAELADVCSDEDTAIDDRGGRYLRPECSKPLPTVDHVVPQVLGGSSDPRNLVLACRPCNSSKGGR